MSAKVAFQNAQELKELRARLRRAEDALRAIRSVSDEPTMIEKMIDGYFRESKGER